MDSNIAKLKARLNYYQQKKNKPTYSADKVKYNRELYHRRKEEMKTLKETVVLQQEYINELESQLSQ